MWGDDLMTKHDLQTEMNQVELLIGKIMRIGVLIAAFVMIIGLGLLLVTGKSGYSGTFYPTTLQAIIAGVCAFKAAAWMMLGIFLLILTPVLRVVISIYAFAKEKDHLYVWITSIVLVILIISFIIGHH